MAAKLDYTYAADALAEKAGVNDSVLSALINAESSWHPGAVSPTGATGLGQFTQATAIAYGLMGNGFDNRADAALNLTAAVKYLADLRRTNPTWRAVIGHYSGQGTALAGYAGYSAGKALIATIDMADGTVITTVPPPPPAEGETVTVSVSDQAGRRGSATIPLVSAMMVAVVSGALMMAPRPTEERLSGPPASGSPRSADVSAEPLDRQSVDQGTPGSTFCSPKDLRWLLAPSPCSPISDAGR